MLRQYTTNRQRKQKREVQRHAFQPPCPAGQDLAPLQNTTELDRRDDYQPGLARLLADGKMEELKALRGALKLSVDADGFATVGLKRE